MHAQVARVQSACPPACCPAMQGGQPDTAGRPARGQQQWAPSGALKAAHHVTLATGAGALPCHVSRWPLGLPHYRTQHCNPSFMPSQFWLPANALFRAVQGGLAASQPGRDLPACTRSPLPARWRKYTIAVCLYILHPLEYSNCQSLAVTRCHPTLDQGTAGAALTDKGGGGKGAQCITGTIIGSSHSKSAVTRVHEEPPDGGQMPQEQIVELGVQCKTTDCA